MIPINGSNSSGVNLNKYVLKNVFNTVTNDLSEQINTNKLSIEEIKNKVDSTNDPYEWKAVDVSNEYTSEYNMKRCFNKYGDTFLIRSTTVTTIGDLTIHECHVNTVYGPNIQYTFISDYVYLPAWIRDKNDDKIIYHIAECDLLMNKNTINCSAKKIEFGEGWNRVLIRFSSTFEYIKINSDCLYLGIGNNPVLKYLDLLNCYQLINCEIVDNPKVAQAILKNRPTTFSASSYVKVIVLDEMNDSINSINSSITTLDSSINSITSSITTMNSSITTLNTKVSSNTTSISSLNTRVTTLENKPEVTQSLFGPRYTTTPSNLTDLTADFEIHDNYTNNDWHISKTECYYKGGYSSTIPKLLFPPCLKGYITQNLTLSAAKSGSDMLFNLDIDLSACCTRNLEFNGVTVSASIVLPEFFLYYAFTTGNDACNFSLNNSHISAQICELKLNGQYMQFNASGSSCNTLGDLTKIQLVLTQCHKSRIEPITYNGQSSNIFNVIKAWA